jgi:UDP-N-acetylglucosamine:LPS N-acetylglucosamine transferase
LLKDKLPEVISSTIFNEEKLKELKINAAKLNRPDAAEEIADSAIKLAAKT